MELGQILNNRKKELINLIEDFYTSEYAEKFDEFLLKDTAPLVDSAKAVLETTPKAFGLCTVMSAYLYAFLVDTHKLPAVVVTGDLIILGIPAFQTEIRIQQQNSNSDIVIDDWKGHCWVEVGGMICDVSIGRTADLAPNNSNLKSFVHSKFGKGKGLLAFPVEAAYAENMVYIPKEVLSDNTITAIIKSYHSK